MNLKEDSLAYVPSSNPKEHNIFKEIEIIDCEDLLFDSPSFFMNILMKKMSKSMWMSPGQILVLLVAL
jgi:hypothetical protein